MTSVGKDVEKKEPSYAVGGNVNQCSCNGRQCGDSTKNKESDYHMIQLSHFWVFMQRL